MSLTVIVPSRARPGNARRLVEAFEDTCALPDTLLVFGVDDDDPAGGEYLPLRSGRVRVDVLPATGQPGMNAALNRMARGYAPDCTVIGFMGDDHVPRSAGWDRSVAEALQAVPGVAYADDLLQGEALPTQVFLTSSVVTTLGWMAPPRQQHLYLDNFWLRLGREVGVTYLRGVVIEHMHPFAHKAPPDQQYALVNDQRMYHRDRLAFEEYLRTGFAGDVQRVKAVLGG